MSMTRAVPAALALLLAAAPLPAPAQSDGSATAASEPDGGAAATPDPGSGSDASPPDRKEYLVEVVTFQYLGPDSTGGETFDHLSLEDYLPAEAFNLQENDRLGALVSYTEMKELDGALEKLRLSGRYRVMSNTAWVQPLLGRGRAVAVPLGYASRTGGASLHAATADPVSSRVSGSLRVYGDYLLFVDIDLKAELPAPAGEVEERGGQQSGTTGYTTVIGASPDDGPGARGGFQTFRISEKRRIKLEEFHYFDHPYFGAIVSVVRH